MKRKGRKICVYNVANSNFPWFTTPDFASKDSFLEEKVTRRGVGGEGGKESRGKNRVRCRNRGVILYPGRKEMEKDTTLHMVVCLEGKESESF